MISRYIVLILTLVAIIVWMVYLIKCRDKWLYTLAPLLWLINVGAFWVYRLFIWPGVDVEMINGWSVGIYIHAMITLIAVGIVVIGETKRC